MNKSKAIGLILLIITVVMWGISFISIKISMDVFPPLSLAFYRFVIASIILFPIMKYAAPKEKLLKKDIPLMATAGIIGITIYFFFENNGILRISASAASVIIAFMPVVAAFGEIFFLKKIPKLTALLAVALSILGVYLVIGGDLSSEGSLLGYLYMLGAAISFSIYIIITKPLFDTYSDVTVSFYQSLFGCLAFIPFLGFEKVSWSQINPEISIHFIFLAVFCSGIATYFYMFALNNLGVTISAVFMNLIPVVTFIASYFWYEEIPSSIQLLGAVIVIISVSIVTLSEKSKEINN